MLRTMPRSMILSISRRNAGKMEMPVSEGRPPSPRPSTKSMLVSWLMASRKGRLKRVLRVPSSSVDINTCSISTQKPHVCKPIVATRARVDRER
jgi:hypothetical protein